MEATQKIINKIDDTLTSVEKIADKLTFSLDISRNIEGELIVEVLVRNGNEVEKLHNLHPILGIFGNPVTLKQFIEDAINTNG